MGLAVISKGKPPSTLLLDLTCDMPRCSEHQRFVAEPDQGYPEIYSQAMRAGWLERFGTSDLAYRLFLCPLCSGKEPKAK